MKIMKTAALMLALAVSAGATGTASQKVVKTEMPNGLTVLVKPEPGSGLVALEAFVKAGVAQERSFEAGISTLVARTLLASTRNLRAEKLAAIADEVGGNFETVAHADFTQIRAVTTSGRFDEAMHLLGEVLTNATFEASAVQIAKAEMMADEERKQDEVFESAYQELRLQLYRDNPYRRAATGYPATVRKVTSLELQEFFGKYYVPNNIVISIAGDVSPERALERVRLAFAGTGPKTLPVDRGVPDEKMPKSRSWAMQRDIRLAYFMIGFLAPGINSSDYPAMAVASAALGAGKSSRLFRNLREKQGIGYDLGIIYPKLKNQSHMVAYLITDPFKMDLPGFNTSMALEEAKQAFFTEVNEMQQKPLTDDELLRAKRYCIGTYALEHQRLRERAYHLGHLEAVGRGYAFDSQYAAAIEAVTKADVQRVLANYLGNYAVVVVLPQDSAPANPGG